MQNVMNKPSRTTQQNTMLKKYLLFLSSWSSSRPGISTTSSRSTNCYWSSTTWIKHNYLYKTMRQKTNSNSKQDSWKHLLPDPTLKMRSSMFFFWKSFANRPGQYESIFTFAALIRVHIFSACKNTRFNK